SFCFEIRRAAQASASETLDRAHALDPIHFASRYAEPRKHLRVKLVIVLMLLIQFHLASRTSEPRKQKLVKLLLQFLFSSTSPVPRSHAVAALVTHHRPLLGMPIRRKVDPLASALLFAIVGKRVLQSRAPTPTRHHQRVHRSPSRNGWNA